MTCDPRLISYYRDGALSRDERYELESHMRECAECSAQFRGLMRLAQVVRSLPMEPVSQMLRHGFCRWSLLRGQRIHDGVAQQIEAVSFALQVHCFRAATSQINGHNLVKLSRFCAKKGQTHNFRGPI